MRIRKERFTAYEYAAFGGITLAVMLLCVCAGSVSLPVSDTLSSIWNSVFGIPQQSASGTAIIVSVRLPRVLCAALTGAALSLSGAAMQGLLRNPLADGTTLGVSSGASLGAVAALAFGLSVPGAPFAATTVFAILAAFASLALILALAQRIDCSLSTNTIILLGVIFSMFAGSITSLIVTFAGEKVRSIMFWSMGSLSGSSYANAVTLLVTLLIFGTVIFCCTRELNAFAIGEDNARSIGVNVRRVKLLVLIAASALIGVSVSVGGTIGFVGLVIPHMTRMLTGPNHRRLLPASTFFGACFLMLADLFARVVLNPLELPIGVVTSFIGSIVFVYIFFRNRRHRA